MKRILFQNLTAKQQKALAVKYRILKAKETEDPFIFNIFSRGYAKEPVTDDGTAFTNQKLIKRLTTPIVYHKHSL